MPKIKLIKVYYRDLDSDSFVDKLESFSDWEEISQEDLNFLKSYKGQQFLRSKTKYDCEIILIEDITSSEIIKEYITGIKELIKKEKELISREEQAKKERSLVLKKKKEEREIEKAKKILKDAGLSVGVK